MGKVTGAGAKEKGEERAGTPSGEAGDGGAGRVSPAGGEAARGGAGGRRAALTGGVEDRRGVRGGDRGDAPGRPAGRAIDRAHVPGRIHAPALRPRRRATSARPAGDEPGGVRAVPGRGREHGALVGAG